MRSPIVPEHLSIIGDLSVWRDVCLKSCILMHYKEIIFEQCLAVKFNQLLP